jgi:DNA-binding NarL/FixJ family response regulator
MRIIGRARELELIATCRAQSALQSATLSFDSEAGGGKTALLDAAVEAAGDEMLILRCSPTLAESSLPYAALGDLLVSIADLSCVAPTPRAGLEQALLRADPSSLPTDARLVGLGCVAVWQHLADQGPVLIVIDDLQWLDQASAAALAFSVRRLPKNNVLVLAARRTGEPSIELPGDAVALGPLAPDDLMAILVDRTHQLATPLAGRALRLITESAAGNPLYALELARELIARPGGVADPLVVPSSLTDLLLRRFGAIDRELGDALACVALLAKPELSIVRRLGILGAVSRAEAEGFVETSSGRVVFGHPLFGAAILDQVPTLGRRSLHRRLAAVVDSPVEAVRHLGLAAEGPDSELAARLSREIDGLLGRGAVDEAAQLAELAARLTPESDDDHPARYVSAAHLAFQSGESGRAIELLARVDGALTPAPVRVRELLVRAMIAYSAGSAIEARDAALSALEKCTTDSERIEVRSTIARVSYDHFPTAAEHAAEALALAERTDVSPGVLASALIAWAGTRCMIGEGLDQSAYHRAIELERGSVYFAADSAFGSLAALLKIVDRVDEARTMLLQLLADTDDDGSLPYALSHLPQLELWTGNWDLAEDYAHRHLEAALRTGQHDQVSQAQNNLALIDAYRGDTARAVELAQTILVAGRESGDAWTERSGAGLLGFVALSEGDAPRAVELLERWYELGEQMGLREPGYNRLAGDLVEALVAAGSLERATVVGDRMNELAERLDRPTLVAAACRVRALVAAARGDRITALELAQRAVELSSASPFVFDRARCWLTLGQIHRRFKEKSAARSALQTALAEFERLGAERFVHRTRQDLARIGLRPAASLGLTETEQRVAELAATGKTVRQVGDELFISAKTVEANLTRIYRKLGFSGRAELATWAATRGVEA